MTNLKSVGLDVGPPPKDALEFSSLVADLFNRWRAAQHPGSSKNGRELRPDASLLVWDAGIDRLNGVVVPPGWFRSIAPLPAGSEDIRWRLLSPDAARGPDYSATRTLTEVGIPGRIEFSSDRNLSAAASSRRSLLLGGAGLMLMVILGAGYVVHRAISRELEVIRLQADFVAAVSHEFRAPLTTLRTITKLLVQKRIPDEARRQQSYVFLDSETTRLHRLVEDLLSLDRLQLRTESHDGFKLARATVAGLAQQAKANGFSIEADLGSPDSPALATVHVDQEAFDRALRNLLENAMKYSPVCRTVWVNGAVQGHRVLISVRDEGMGIGAEEQRTVFQKFVRGDAAKKAGIKGTGLGLAMVQQIAHAMGGGIRLQSEVGVGSTFTLVLPLANG